MQWDMDATWWASLRVNEIPRPPHKRHSVRIRLTGIAEVFDWIKLPSYSLVNLSNKNQATQNTAPVRKRRFKS